MYEPTSVAISTPRTLFLEGSWVAIGGSVTIVREAPKLPSVINEATASQYKQLYDLGYTTLIKKKVELKNESDNVDIRLTNSPSNTGRKRDIPVIPKV